MENTFMIKMQNQSTLIRIENRDNLGYSTILMYIHEIMDSKDIQEIDRYLRALLLEANTKTYPAEIFQQTTFEKLFEILLSNQLAEFPSDVAKFIKLVIFQVKFDPNIFKILENNQHYFARMREYIDSVGQAAPTDPLAIGICEIISYIAQCNSEMNAFVTNFFPLDYILNTMGQNPECISLYLYSVSKCNLSKEVFECTVNILKEAQNADYNWINTLLNTIELYITPDVYIDVQDTVEFVNLFIISFLRDQFFTSACKIAKEFFSMLNQVPVLTCEEKFEVSSLVGPIIDRITHLFPLKQSEIQEYQEKQKKQEEIGKMEKIEKEKKGKEEKVEDLDPIPPLEALHEIILYIKAFPNDFVVNYLDLYQSPVLHGFKQIAVKEIYVRLIVIIISISPEKIELILDNQNLMQFFTNLLESDQPEYALELFCLIHDYFAQQFRQNDIETLTNNLADYREVIADCIDSPNPKIREFATQLDNLFTAE